MRTDQEVAVQFRILGPLAVEVNGEVVDLGPRKQRSLFALLLINNNRVVSTDRILDELWGDDADGKENALWVYISRLRGALGEVSDDDILVTRDHGYTLKIDPNDLDGHRFEQLARQGSGLLVSDPEAAADILREALNEWRGNALEEFAYEDFARPDIARLEELRNSAVENRIDADLRRGLSGELIGELERIVESRPNDERPVNQLMLALYRAGRQADALRSFERYRRSLGEELGLDPSPELRRLEEQILLHDSRLQPARSRMEDEGRTRAKRTTNPFRGLEAFREEDSDVFFGRDRVVADILKRINQHTIIAVVGASGCGKSSAVRSGVIPAIRKGAIDESDSWLVASMIPDGNPMAELEAALLRTRIDAPDSLRDQLDGEPDEALRAVLRISPADDSTILLLIDQFEELFTVCEPTVTERFLTALVTAAEDPRKRLRIVVTLRSDFYDGPLGHAKFGTAMGPGVVNVVPMAPEELEQAASKPAAVAGVRLEPGLEAALIGDVLGEPGALPLFEFALTDLFDRRVGDTLTLGAYREMGGIRGAISRKAEHLYERLTKSQRAVARQIFLRLVAISDTEARSRRRIEAAELLGLDLDVGDLHTVIDAFGRERLLSFDRNEVTGAPTVEVAHEALLEHWDRLAGWIEEGKEDVLRNARLVAAAAEWHDNGCDPGYLLSGRRLDAYQRWADGGTMTLAQPERDYLEASIALRDTLMIADAKRIATETATTRRAKRNAWSLVAVVVAAAIVGSYFIWAAIQPEGPTVALLYTGSTDSINDMVISGFNRADQDLAFVPKKHVVVAEMEGEMRLAAEAGADLIIVGLDLGWVIEQVAEEFPETTFVILDPGLVIPEDNVAHVSFSDAEGAYLMGAIAAMTSETQHVGIVGAGQFDFIEQFISAFDSGARSVDSDVDVSVTWIGQSYSYAWGYGFNNPEEGREAASHLFDLGVDVIFHVANESGSGVHAAASEYSKSSGKWRWSIGVDVDEGFEADADVARHVLTSMVKRLDTAVYETIKLYLEGNMESTIEYGLSDGGIAYSTFGDHLGTREAEIEAVKAQIIAGTADLPLITAVPSSFRSIPTQTIDVAFNGHECVSSPINTATVGDTISFTFFNRTDEPAAIVLASTDSSVPTDVLLASRLAFYEHSWAHNHWIVPPHADYELHTEFEGEPFDSGIVLCFAGDTDGDPFIATRFTVIDP